MARLRFLGAAGMVSGSRHLIETDESRVLFDCGLFQGEKDFRERNWQRFPVPASSVDAVVLTHGHIDHSGWLPRLVKEGFQGPIHVTPATADLLGLLLYDSAKCQAEDALYANRKGYAKHRPALPLYEEHDVDRTLRLLEVVPREQWFEPARGVRCRYHEAGHMLGSSFVETEVATPGGIRRVLFSATSAATTPRFTRIRPLPSPATTSSARAPTAIATIQTSSRSTISKGQRRRRSSAVA
jgi:metallo-beta-lactamase family protein